MKEKTLTERLLALKVGQSFTVKDDAERQEVYSRIRLLREENRLTHEIKSTYCAGGFKFYAI
jgi:hypothetical protein